MLTDDQTMWVKQTSERVLKILRETPPDGELFTNTVTVNKRLHGFLSSRLFVVIGFQCNCSFLS